MMEHGLQVALVTETFAPEVNGVAMTLGRLSQGLIERGHSVQVVRPRQQGESAGRQADGAWLTAGLPIPGYPQLRFGLTGIGRLQAEWRARRPDVVHVATEGPLGLAALMAARRLDLPVLTTFHTNFDAYSRHYGIGWLRGGIEAYLLHFHRRARMTLAPTRQLVRTMQARGLNTARVLSRGVDTRLFHPERRSEPLRGHWDAGSRDPVCLVVGRVAAEKNLALAFDAFAAIQADRPNARMVCVGDGPLAASLARRHPAVHFCGMRHGEDLARHYASADLFLFPSLTETFGNVVGEALASGLPVVAFARAAAAELVVTGRNGHLVTPGDAPAFIAASRALARSIAPPSQHRVAHAESIAHLDWNSVCDGYVEYLLEAAATSIPPCAAGESPELIQPVTSV